MFPRALAGGLCVLSLLACLAGCGSTPRPALQLEISAPPSDLPDDCASWPANPQQGGTIVVALADSVNPGHAPIPHNDSEQMVFRNLYETLVQVTCDGSLQPGLAQSWTSSQGDKLWIFTLRDSIRFWDGTLLTAQDVKASWIQAEASPWTETGRTPLVWLNARAQSVQVLDAHRLAIHLPESQSDFPLLLAHAAMAVAAQRPGWQWPVGTGPFRLTADAGVPRPDLVCLPWGPASRRPVLSRLVFRVLAGKDPRDVLGGAADVLLVRDRPLLSYFERVPQATVTPLPWDRIYLLLTPQQGSERDRERWYTGWDRIELARDVVAATAEPIDEPYFLPPSTRLCPQLTGPVETLSWPTFSWSDVTASLDTDLILHPAGEEDAQRLAERIAVLAARPLRPGPNYPGRGPLTPPRPPIGAAAPQAVAVPPRDFPGALQSGRAGAYVLPLHRNYPSACLQMSELLGMAQWLRDAGLDVQAPSTVYPATARAGLPEENFDLSEATEAARRLEVTGVVVPLVAERASLVSRAPLAGLRLAYDGTVLWDRAGWVAATGAEP